jgi:D-2-hydroxyacid dehydrogenase (NADP+)
VHLGSAGVDGVPLDALPPQVVVTSGKGPMAISVAEHALSLMLALARQLPEAVRDQQSQHWPPGGGLAVLDRVRELHGRTILILGVGATGGELARICKLGFGMRVLGFVRTQRNHPHVDAYVDRAGLPAALGEADFVCVALALTDVTHHLDDAAPLAAMKPTAFMINIARGELVDEHALVSALQERRIAGAGLDSVQAEPLPAEHPLWRLPNVLITPHRAAGSDGFWPIMKTSLPRISAASATVLRCSASSTGRPATDRSRCLPATPSAVEHVRACNRASTPTCQRGRPWHDFVLACRRHRLG